jgi:predicted GIY-YIG superfamily endonuclease
MTLLLRLKDYRQIRSAIDQVPIYCVFGDTVMRSIAQDRPLSMQALHSIRGLTPEKCEQYGAELLRLVRETPALEPAQPPAVGQKPRHYEHKPPPISWGGKRLRGGRRQLLQHGFPFHSSGIKPATPPGSFRLRQTPPLKSTAGDDHIYVLELSQGRVYVGRTSDWRRRLTQHMSGKGSAFTQAFPPTGTLLPRLGCVSGSAEAAERDETLRYMFLRGIQLVRGWKYTRVYMPEEEVQDAEENIRELYDLCRRCGHPGHFMSQCKAHFDRLGRPCK